MNGQLGNVSSGSRQLDQLETSSAADRLRQPAVKGKTMDFNDAISIGRETMILALLLSTPIVVVSLVVGLIISIAQTVTSIQEQTLSFAPRIVAVVAIILLLTPWYLTMLKAFALRMFEKMSEVGV